MSIAALVPTAIGGTQATVSTARQMANLLAGFQPSFSGLDLITRMAKDIGTFQFNYIGEERLEAGTEITEHYAEDNKFMQDHCAVRPSIVVMRGFVAETNFNKNSILPFLTALGSALTPVTPYIGRYSPGTAAKMAGAISQTNQIINQLAQIQGVAGGVNKLIKSAGKIAGAASNVRSAYDALDALRTSGTTFAVVTPWATFGNNAPNNSHGPMMIENLVMVSPEDTRGWVDIVVRLKEIKVAPSLLPTVQDNARGSQVSTFSGTEAAN